MTLDTDARKMLCFGQAPELRIFVHRRIEMSEYPYAEVFVTFLPTEVGGRARLVNLDDHGYRPHFRVAPDGE
jgi:hypothetical protein